MQQFRQPGFPQNVAQRSHAQAPRRGGIGTFEFASHLRPIALFAHRQTFVVHLHVAHTGHNLLLSLHFALSAPKSPLPP